ncbi:MAG: PD40 domain-containing protein [Bacteroidia bacterium]|nr:PD40 domain-containing protein [Bacteroidia bacterium]
MKKILIYALLLCVSKQLQAQISSETDIFLASCKLDKTQATVQTPENITHRTGYDNQPSFSKDGSLIFYVAYKDEKQADIFSYSIEQKTSSRITNTPESEYSPYLSEDEKFISLVRVEKDSSQRFKKYVFENFGSEAICNELDSIGYYHWINESNFAFFKITEPPSLWQVNIKNCQEKFLAKNIGRSIRPKNNSELFITQLIDSVRWICIINLKSGKVLPIIACLPGSEDFSVYDSQNIIQAKGAKLYAYFPTKGTNWIEIADFEKQGISNIKRIAISKDLSKIAFVNDSSKP